ALGHLVGDEREFLLEVGEGAAHEPLDAVNRVVGVAEAALAGFAADEDAAVVVEADDARDEGDASLVADHDGPAAVHVGGEAEGGAQVDADDGWWHDAPNFPVADPAGEVSLIGR